VPAPSHPATQRVAASNFVENRLIAPPVIPTHTLMTQDLEPAPEIPFGASTSGVYQGLHGDFLSSLSHEFSRVAPPAALKPSPSAKAPPISRWMEGNLIRKVQPIYPVIARSAGIQGPVVLRALINRDGRIEQINVVKGHPMLVKAAVDAVSQWLYRPYYLNDKPVEVETQVTVNFTLGR
jgi:periplasmic protein TonB